MVFCSSRLFFKGDIKGLVRGLDGGEIRSVREQTGPIEEGPTLV